MEYPVLVWYQSGESTVAVEAVTKNVSLGGLLMRSAAMISLHRRVTFRISIRDEKTARSIHLAGAGKIVRVASSANEADFAIAVECEIPITQLE